MTYFFRARADPRRRVGASPSKLNRQHTIFELPPKSVPVSSAQNNAEHVKPKIIIEGDGSQAPISGSSRPKGEVIVVGKLDQLPHPASYASRASGSANPWSPATTVRSTPPQDDFVEDDAGQDDDERKEQGCEPRERPRRADDEFVTSQLQRVMAMLNFTKGKRASLRSQESQESTFSSMSSTPPFATEISAGPSGEFDSTQVPRAIDEEKEEMGDEEKREIDLEAGPRTPEVDVEEEEKTEITIVEHGEDMVKNPFWSTNGPSPINVQSVLAPIGEEESEAAGSNAVPTPRRSPLRLQMPAIPGPDGPGSDADDDSDVENTSDEDMQHQPQVLADIFCATASSLERDIEAGGVRMRDAAGRPIARQASSVVADAQVAQQAVTVEEARPLVLPCGPSDAEKISYHRTHRFAVLFAGLLSFVALSSGMWLFTIVSPYFFWFGAPTTFLMIYLILSYFAVAVWGKDFDREEHAEVVKKGDEQGYTPTVDIFLPVCNEPLEILRNTWTYVAALDYPHFTVHVLDDGAKAEVKQMAGAFGFNYILRNNRPVLKKAGNLRYAFGQTSGDAIVIFDADFCPRGDFLRETLPYFTDPSIAIVQTPQFFRCRKEQTWVEKGAGSTQEFFYRLVQMNQDRFNASVCVGSCGVYRREALEPLGGMAAVSHSEDMVTGYQCTELGYKVKYVPLNLAMGTCPDEPRAFFMQQYRWCMGSAALVFRKDFWQSNISPIHKICFCNGMLYYIATALAIFLWPIPMILLIYLLPAGMHWYHMGFVLPAIFFAGFVIPLWATQEYDMACHRVKIIQSFAHLYAIKDRVMNTAVPWVPSGGGASSRSSSSAYTSSVRLLIIWTTSASAIVLAGAIWRMTEYPWYHFVPSIIFTLGNWALNMSTLVYV